MRLHVSDSSGERISDGHGQCRQFRPSQPVLAAQPTVAAALPHAVHPSVNIARRRRHRPNGLTSEGDLTQLPPVRHTASPLQRAACSPSRDSSHAHACNTCSSVCDDVNWRGVKIFHWNYLFLPCSNPLTSAGLGIGNPAHCYVIQSGPKK